MSVMVDGAIELVVVAADVARIVRSSTAVCCKCTREIRSDSAAAAAQASDIGVAALTDVRVVATLCGDGNRVV